MSQILEQFKPDFEKIIFHYKEELDKVRAGRAIPIMIEDVFIDAYGTKTPLKQVASISVPEPSLLAVEPWDKSILKEIEKALTKADLGMSISVAENLVRAKIQPLTEEKRKDLMKIINEKKEEARVSIRQIRDKVRRDIETKEKNKEISEDEKFDYFKKIDDIVKEKNQIIEEMTDKKEKDIMTV